MFCRLVVRPVSLPRSTVEHAACVNLRNSNRSSVHPRPMTMTSVKGESSEAASEAEVADTAPTQQQPRNAFSELMSQKKPSKPTQKQTPSTTSTTPHKILSTEEQRNLNYTHGRGALAVYTTHPTWFPPTRVLSVTDDFVVIKDLYPKSSIHLLLLPRNPAKQLLHPFDALDGSDANFIAAVKAETANLRALAASELRRLYGRFSHQDAARNAALDGDVASGTNKLPQGRDWSADVISGVHAVPSMQHLHVHVLSVDRVSECLKDKKHYNSFATPFLVPVEDMPLASDDPRRRPTRQGYMERELTCWRCGRGFGNAMAKLKRHLAEELEVWKAL